MTVLGLKYYTHNGLWDLMASCLRTWTRKIDHSPEFPKGAKYQNAGASEISILGVVIMVLGRCLVFRHLDV